MDTKTRPDRLTHAPIFSVSLFFLSVLIIFFFPSYYFQTVSLSISSFLSCHLLSSPLPCPFSLVSSSQVELCETGLGFMPCTVQWVPCQALRLQGYSPGTGALAGAQASVACALVSWQSSWKLNTLDLDCHCHQRHCSDLTCTIFAEYYVTVSKGKRDEMQRVYGMWDITSCCCCCCCISLNKRWF